MYKRVIWQGLVGALGFYSRQDTEEYSAVGLFGILTNLSAQRGSSVGFASAWHVDGRGFDPHVR